MDTRLYPTRIHILLDTVGEPQGQVYLDHMPVTFERVISGPTEFVIERELLSGAHCLQIRHTHKAPEDPDTALIVRSICFNDIATEQTIWRGRYQPDYPEPWATQQLEQGIQLDQELTSNYLGWNGVWRLEFSAPVFTWLHEVQNLGWIYR